MTPEQTLEWLAEQHFDQCREERPIQGWIRNMKMMLPKQEQGEPVAIVCSKGPKFHHVAILTASGKQLEDGTKLYTTPQQRPWVGLTDDEIKEIHHQSFGKDIAIATGLTEAKLKDKNT